MRRCCQSSSFHQVKKVEKKKLLFRAENFFFRDANLINDIAYLDRDKLRDKSDVLSYVIKEC
jgi:hypothetical protein